MEGNLIYNNTRIPALEEPITATCMESRDPLPEASQDCEVYARNPALYVTGIAVDCESDEEIGEKVKEHLRLNCVRVMKFKVIRLRAVHDVVGCRIIVPQSQEHIPLNPEIWPDQYIKCRRWERAEEYHKNSKYTSYNNDWAHDYNEGSYERRY